MIRICQNLVGEKNVEILCSLHFLFFFSVTSVFLSPTIRYSILIPSITLVKSVRATVHALNVFSFPYIIFFITINGFLHVQLTPCTYWQIKCVYYIGKVLKFTYLLHWNLKTEFQGEGSYAYLTCGTGQRSAVVFTERKAT